MTDLIPSVRGPKLFQFKEDFADAIFIEHLNPSDEASGAGIHGRVFKVRIKETIYAVKIFNFVSLDDIRPPLLLDDQQIISDNVIKHQLDPFFAECRAFGLLTSAEKDQDLAVPCYGYVFLSEPVERQLEKLGKFDWNRPPNSNKPLRAIVKKYINYRSFYRPSNFTRMRDRLKQLNKMGIYNMDIRKDNYLGGRLFDFSTAITIPHISFSLDLRTQAQIMEDIEYDLACFDAMVKSTIDQDERAKTDRWKNLRSRSDPAPTKAARTKSLEKNRSNPKKGAAKA